MPDFPKRVLVATDGSKGATLAVEAAAEIAAGAGSELHLVHVWPGPPLPPVGRLGPHAPFADDSMREPERGARELLRGQAWRAKTAGATVAETHLREGRPAEEIAALAEGVGADLVVVGSREMGALGRLALGSVSNRVAREASRPVLVVRGGWPPSRVVVGDDLSEEAGKASELAAIVGGLYGAPVRLTTAYTPGNWYVDYAAHRRRTRETERGIGRALRGRAAALGKALGEKPHTEVAPRRPDDLLQEASKEGKATLVAVGRRDLGTARRAVTGSVSGGVLGSAGGPVLVVPSSAGKGSQDDERGRSRLRGRPAPAAPTSRRPRTSAKTGDYPR